MGNQTLCRRFAKRLDALRAQDLFDHATLLHYRDLLQVRLERAIGRALREGTAVTEGGCFSAGVTLCHDIYPFNTMIPDERPFWGQGILP